MDATVPIRALLKEKQLHDYEIQERGQDAKAKLKTVVLSGGAVVETTASLYRPETKDGDPRIWFSKLNAMAEPTDLIAVLAGIDGLVVVNCSKSNLVELLSNRSSPLWANVLAPSTSLPKVADELLGLLRDIGAQGYVPTKRPGDTGVGYTLETMLGIVANSSKAPDYKGIELKAGRASSHVSGRTTIFSQVPSWSISRLKSSRELLQERGRFSERKGRKQLFHEINAIKPNSYGLLLELDEASERLDQVHVVESARERDVTWIMAKLCERLVEKHRETFWVTAETKGRGPTEEFHYSEARYTSGSNPHMLPVLLETGVISLDYTISETKSGAAKDKGYLFKLRQRDLSLLFRAPRTFRLCE